MDKKTKSTGFKYPPVSDTEIIGDKRLINLSISEHYASIRINY